MKKYKVVLVKKIKYMKDGNYVYEVLFDNRFTSERIITADKIFDGDVIYYDEKKKIWKLYKETNKKTQFLLFLLFLTFISFLLIKGV